LVLLDAKRHTSGRTTSKGEDHWLNAVEGFFAKLTKRRLKRGVFLSVVDLQAAINRFVLEHNAEPKPFTWTADPDKIIQAVRRGHQVLDSIH
jgi:urease gamma subunit